MKRRTVNFIRFILEDLLPPILRDSFVFKFIIENFYRKDKTHKILKKEILWLSDQEYKNYYANMPNIQGDTDNSDECIEKIIQNILPHNVIDVGCGNGYLLKKIKEKDLQNQELKLFGSEIVKTDKLNKISIENYIEIYEKPIEKISDIGLKFDTTICTHVLEHVLEINKAYEELKKITKKRLIIVVPKERPYKYTFNGHIHFFPYDWSFINTIKPKTKNFKIYEIYRDFIYIEDFY
tara:strand:+ start:1518 stop:2228 length:711 start_codon:yes stop_codon:yes gene_type:complete